MARQLLKRSFRTFIQANLEADRGGAMLVLYRLARPDRSARRLAPLVVAGTVLLLAPVAAVALRRRARRA